MTAYYLFEEQLSLTQLLAGRGRSFVLGMLPDASEDTLARVIAGMPIQDADARYIKRVLKERMTHDDMSAPVVEMIQKLRDEAGL